MSTTDTDPGGVLTQHQSDSGQLDLPMVVDVPLFPHQPPPSRLRGGDQTTSLQEMVMSTLKYGRYGSFYSLMADVGRLSQHRPFNALLALLQLPAASYLLSARRWETSYRRRILPGQQPVVLLLPKGPVMFVFDVSQTEATADSRPLPDALRNPFAMVDAVGVDRVLAQLMANVKGDGVRFHAAREGMDRAGCIWPVAELQTQPVLMQGDITVKFPVRYESLYNDAYSPTERLATIAHELGHLYCGHVGTISEHRWPDRTHLATDVKEREAESVARVVFGRLFPETEMPSYRDMPPNNGLPNLEDVSFKLVMDAVGWILQDTLGPRRYVVEKDYNKSRVTWPTPQEPFS